MAYGRCMLDPKKENKILEMEDISEYRNKIDILENKS